MKRVSWKRPPFRGRTDRTSAVGLAAALAGTQEKSSKASSSTELLRQRIEHIDERMSRSAERLKALDDDGGSELIERLESEKCRDRRALGATDENMETAREQADSQRAAIAGCDATSRLAQRTGIGPRTPPRAPGAHRVAATAQS
jgi:hypothetical protein